MAWHGAVTGAAISGSVLGFVACCMFENLLEAPRLSALFFLICMAGLVQFEERRHRPRQLEAKGIASMPGETYVE